jgi:hypothetical protein
MRQCHLEQTSERSTPSSLPPWRQGRGVEKKDALFAPRPQPPSMQLPRPSLVGRSFLRIGCGRLSLWGDRLAKLTGSHSAALARGAALRSWLRSWLCTWRCSRTTRSGLTFAPTPHSAVALSATVAVQRLQHRKKRKHIGLCEPDERTFSLSVLVNPL